LTCQNRRIRACKQSPLPSSKTQPPLPKFLIVAIAMRVLLLLLLLQMLVSRIGSHGRGCSVPSVGLWDRGLTGIEGLRRRCAIAAEGWGSIP